MVWGGRKRRWPRVVPVRHSHLGANDGFGILFDISSQTLTQTLVPDRLLGRVQSVSRVLALSGVPLGAFLGGIVVERMGNVALVFVCIGAAIFLVALGRTDRYLPGGEASERA